MSKFIIQGKQELSGLIEVGGAKNLALKAIPACLLSKEKMTLFNFPLIEDTKRSLELLTDLGGTLERNNDKYHLQCQKIKKFVLEPNFANKFRASIMFVGPLLARIGEVKFSHPGGCVIGAGTRPIDLFLEGFKALGAEVKIEENFYHLKAKKLTGGKYFFTTISVTGTECLMMTAVLAAGKTILKNCAMEPEIVFLADYLNKNGAKIQGAGTPTVCIEGVKEISAGDFKIMPDRIETGTLAIMAAATKSQITINKCLPEHIESLLAIFNKIGVNYERGNDWLKIKKSMQLKSYNIATHEYPGFPTDLQSPYTVLMTQATGRALIHEVIYDRRLLFADMLTQMGADIIMCDPHRLVVSGPTKLYGKKLTSPDLRAGIAIIIAALIAEKQTEIDNIYQIDRGYENIDLRLNKLGAKIQRIND